MESSFTIWSVYKEAYALLRSRFWPIVQQYAFIAVLFFIVSVLSGKNVILGMLASSIFTFIFTVLSLAYVEHTEFSLSELFRKLTFTRFAYFFLTFLLSNIIILLGSLLIIPGIIFFVWFSFAKYIAVEKQMRPMAALRASKDLTKGHRFQILEFVLLFAIINILGMFCLLIGVFFTVPLTLLAFAIFYKKLSAHHGHKHEHTVI